jgi:hypothetical protein
MWVYYALIIVFFTLVMIKVVDAAAYAIRRQRDTVSKEDWLDLLIEAIIMR